MTRLTPHTTLIALVVFLAMIGASGCTLLGSESAPPATPITSLPTLAPTPTPKPIIPTPSPQATVDVFGTATAIAKTQNLTTTPGAPAAGVTTTPGSAGLTPTAKPPVTPGAGGGQTSGGTTSCPATYTVAAGDTLFRVALKFSLTVQELAAANGITNVELILVGQSLNIPKCGSATTTGGQTTGGTTTGATGADTVAANGDILHTVKAGENLFRIALNYGLSWQVVAAYNGIANSNAITVGQVIRIPTK